MNKIIRTVALVCILSAVIMPALLNIGIAGAASTVDTGTSPSGNSFQRRSFYAAGLEWVFYQKGATWYYQTGNITGNVTAWSGAHEISDPSQRNEYQDLYFDGTYVHGVGCTADSFPTPNAIWYHRGQPLGNGSIIWDPDHLVQNMYSEYTSASVCVNGSGYPFVSASWYTSAASGVQLMHGSANDGTYGSNTIDCPSGWGLHITSGYPGFCGNVMRPMSGNEVLCEWGFTGDGYYGNGMLKANLWNGSAWESTVSCITKQFEPEAMSLETYGSTALSVYLGYDILGPPAYTVVYYLIQTIYDAASNSFVSEGSLALPGNIISYDSYPVLSQQSGGTLTYLTWPDAIHDQFKYVIKSSGVWSPSAIAASGAGVLGVGGHYGYLLADESTTTANYGVYWYDIADNLKFSDELLAPGSALGSALPATSITSDSAQMNGHCIADGNLTTSATFYYAGGGISSGAPESVSAGVVISGEDFNATLSSLYPDTLYWYWIGLTNSAGTTLSNTVYFQTLATSGPDVPRVETLPASFVSDTSAELNGMLFYDGKLDCYLGFRWRVQGSSTWNESMLGTTGEWPFVHYQTYRSPQPMVGTLTGLSPDTSYEYQALAKNGLATSGVYGNTTSFTTLHAPGVTPTPTPAGGGGLGLPPWLSAWLDKLSGNVKTIFAVLITVLSMILVGAKVKTKSTGLLIAGVGAGWVVIFTMIGWYPSYVIIIIGGIIGLAILFKIQGGSH